MVCSIKLIEAVYPAHDATLTNTFNTFNESILGRNICYKQALSATFSLHNHVLEKNGWYRIKLAD
jgi:hypothetical protein